MKIDLSTIALILCLVVPGLAAKKSRRMPTAQTFETIGPTTFQLFTGESITRLQDLIFFLELKLRGTGEFITGELVQYAVVKDEEPHRLVVMRDAEFKASADAEYSRMEGDRVVIDLADAVFVQLSYREREEALTELARST